MVREYTNKLHDLIDEGMINKDDLIRNLLNYLSEDEAKDFAIQYDYIEDEDDDEDGDDDDEEGL